MNENEYEEYLEERENEQLREYELYNCLRRTE